MNKLIFIIALLAHISLLGAQDMFFQRYGINEGLSSNVVFGITEDKNGILWIATTEGVDKFDGLNFKHYSLPQLSLNGVLDYMELHIQSDSSGQIWLATKTGLIYKYDIRKDEFQLIHQFQQNESTGPLVVLRTFYIDNQDNILVSMNDGVWHLNGVSHQVNHISENRDVLYMTQDEEQRYFWSDNRGIQVLDSSFQVQYKLCPGDMTESVGHRISRLYIDNDTHTLWGVSDEEGIFYIDLKGDTCIFPESLSQYKELVVRSIYSFSDDEIVIGVDGVGLVIWNTRTHSLVSEVTYQDGKIGTLSSNAISDIYRNSDGILFISTHRGGINVYNPGKLKFGYMNSIPSSENSLTNNYVLTLNELSPGVIGFGTYEGISIWDKRINRWIHLSDEDEKISEVILSMAMDDRQNIWATSFTNSLIYYKKSDGGYSSGRNLQDLIKVRSRSLHIDRQNRVWLSNHDGLYLYSEKENSVEYFPLDGLLTLLNFSDNLLALGTENGLSFFDTRSYKFRDFDFINESNLEMRLLKSLKLDNQERIWVGSKIDGVFILDFHNETIKHISVENGLPTNHIFSIATGENESWVSTLKGISKIDKDLNVTNYTSSDGIASIDFNYDAAMRDSNGILYFGTNDGVVTLNPQEITAYDPHKNILFSELRLDNRRILPGKDSPLKTETNSATVLELRHNQNSFALGFECVDFIQPERGFFHWQLENFDDGWLVSDNVPNISYNNLNPGDYTFRIKVVDERGELISNEKEISIAISNPFWLTPLAFFIYAILFFLLIWAATYFFRLQEKSRRSSERLGFLINLAHEIKTPLILIKAPLNDVVSNGNLNGTVRKNVSIALSSAERLHRQIIQFLDMGNLSKIERTISLEHMDLVQYISSKITVFKVLADKKNIALSFDYDTPDFSIKMDKKLLDKILSNLLSNAIKYTNERGNVVVRLQVTEGICKILVIDSGIGIIKAEKKNIFKPFYRTDRAKQTGSTGNGMGLVLASNLAKMLNGKLSLLNSTERGSTFEFKFPYELSEIDESIEEAKEEQLIQDENRTKLLLVEDDEELLSFSVSKLQEHYHVITAKNGIEALEKSMEALPNIIISDVLMPQMNGLQLCMKLKEDLKTSHIPVILFTGLDSKEEILEGLEAGADDYIVKPFEFDILIKKVETLLNNRQILKKKFLYQTDESEEIGFASKLDDEWISKVNQFVEEHIEDPELTPPVLCRQFGMSRSTFYHKTKTLVDLSPIELIRTIRLKKAKTMLGRGDNDISEVAYKLGFNDPKYFSTIFKKYFGQTPSSFIAQKKTLRES